VQGKSDVATEPSVAWIAARSEWWAAWIDAKPHHAIRRFGADGKAIGGPIDVGKAYLAGAISAAGSSFGFDPTAEAGSFVEVPIGCAR